MTLQAFENQEFLGGDGFLDKHAWPTFGRAVRSVAFNASTGEATVTYIDGTIDADTFTIPVVPGAARMREAAVTPGSAVGNSWTVTDFVVERERVYFVSFAETAPNGAEHLAVLSGAELIDGEPVTDGAAVVQSDVYHRIDVRDGSVGFGIVRPGNFLAVFSTSTRGSEDFVARWFENEPIASARRIINTDVALTLAAETTTWTVTDFVVEAGKIYHATHDEADGGEFSYNYPLIADNLLSQSPVTDGQAFDQGDHEFVRQVVRGGAINFGIAAGNLLAVNSNTGRGIRNLTMREEEIRPISYFAGLNLAGTIATASDAVLKATFPAAEAGAGALATDTGRLWVYDGSTWTDAGDFRGPAGDKGDKGDAARGIPPGGAIGQVLAKLSDDDYDADWTTISGGGTTSGITTSQKIFSRAMPSADRVDAAIADHGTSAEYFVSNNQRAGDNRAEVMIRTNVGEYTDLDGVVITTSAVPASTVRLPIGTNIRIFSATDFRILGVLPLDVLTTAILDARIAEFLDERTVVTRALTAPATALSFEFTDSSADVTEFGPAPFGGDPVYVGSNLGSVFLKLSRQLEADERVVVRRAADDHASIALSLGPDDFTAAFFHANSIVVSRGDSLEHNTLSESTSDTLDDDVTVLRGSIEGAFGELAAGLSREDYHLPENLAVVNDDVAAIHERGTDEARLTEIPDGAILVKLDNVNSADRNDWRAVAPNGTFWASRGTFLIAFRADYDDRAFFVSRLTTTDPGSSAEGEWRRGDRPFASLQILDGYEVHRIQGVPVGGAEIYGYSQTLMGYSQPDQVWTAEQRASVNPPLGPTLAAVASRGSVETEEFFTYTVDNGYDLYRSGKFLGFEPTQEVNEAGVVTSTSEIRNEGYPGQEGNPIPGLLTDFEVDAADLGFIYGVGYPQALASLHPSLSVAGLPAELGRPFRFKSLSGPGEYRWQMGFDFVPILDIHEGPFVQLKNIQNVDYSNLIGVFHAPDGSRKLQFLRANALAGTAHTETSTRNMEFVGFGQGQSAYFVTGNSITEVFLNVGRVAAGVTTFTLHFRLFGGAAVGIGHRAEFDSGEQTLAFTVPNRLLNIPAAQHQFTFTTTLRRDDGTQIGTETEVVTVQVKFNGTEPPDGEGPAQTIGVLFDILPHNTRFTPDVLGVLISGSYQETRTISVESETELVVWNEGDVTPASGRPRHHRFGMIEMANDDAEPKLVLRCVLQTYDSSGAIVYRHMDFDTGFPVGRFDYRDQLFGGSAVTVSNHNPLGYTDVVPSATQLQDDLAHHMNRADYGFGKIHPPRAGDPVLRFTGKTQIDRLIQRPSGGVEYEARLNADGAWEIVDVEKQEVIHTISGPAAVPDDLNVVQDYTIDVLAQGRWVRVEDDSGNPVPIDPAGDYEFALLDRSSDTAIAATGWTMRRISGALLHSIPRGVAGEFSATNQRLLIGERNSAGGGESTVDLESDFVGLDADGNALYSSETNADDARPLRIIRKG